MSEIESITCPYCKKHKLALRDVRGDGFTVKRLWRCPECPMSFPENWFDDFHHFEHLIVRKL